jgi:hypothetical protein
MFWDELRDVLRMGEAIRGGRCPQCRIGAVLLTKNAEGQLRLSCDNCVWGALECFACDGTGLLGYDSKCQGCGETGVR